MSCTLLLIATAEARSRLPSLCLWVAGLMTPFTLWEKTLPADTFSLPVGS